MSCQSGRIGKTGSQWPQGTLRHWDSKKKKFCVGLDTKKKSDCDEFFFLPENVQVVGSSPRSGKDTPQQSYHVDMKNVLNQDDEGEGSIVCCQFTIDKSILGNILGAKSISDGLESFSLAQDKHEKRVRLQMEKERKEEEYYRKQEEEGRKRRREKARAAREAKEREREKRRQKNDEERKRNSIQHKLLEKMREEFERLEERQRQQWEREKQRLKEEIFENFVGAGYIDEEELNEYFEENDYDSAMDDDPNSFIKKMNRWIKSKAGQKLKDERHEKKMEADRVNAEILGTKHTLLHCVLIITCSSNLYVLCSYPAFLPTNQ